MLLPVLCNMGGGGGGMMHWTSNTLKNYLFCLKRSEAVQVMDILILSFYAKKIL